MNHPKYYNLFLTRCTCTGCGEEYIYPTVWLAREIPKGEAFSRVPENGTVWDLPVNKKEVHDTVPFCMMCVGRVEKTAYVKLDNKAVLNTRPKDAVKPVVELDLKALGLIP